MVTTKDLGFTTNAAFVKEATVAYVYCYTAVGMIFIQGYNKENDFFKSKECIGAWKPVKSVTPDQIQNERQELYKKWGETKNPDILSKHVQLRKRQDRLVAKLPPVPAELEQSAIISFYSDNNFKIKD